MPTLRFAMIIIPYMEPPWWREIFAYLLHNPVPIAWFVMFSVVIMLCQFGDYYLTAFHRKSGCRLMYDGEPEEYRWRWPANEKDD